MISREIRKSVSLICWKICFISLRNLTILRSVSFFLVRLSQISRRLWARLFKIYECCARNTLLDLSGVTEVLFFFNNPKVHKKSLFLEIDHFRQYIDPQDPKQKSTDEFQHWSWWKNGGKYPISSLEARFFSSKLMKQIFEINETDFQQFCQHL